MTSRLSNSYNRGSALMIGLILLMCLTILGVAGMTASRTELSMTANMQFFNTAKASGAGQIDFNMDQNNLVLGQTVADQQLLENLNAANGSWSTRPMGVTPVPGGGNSLNGSIAAIHFEFTTNIEKTGIPVQHAVTQGAYLLGPGPH